jgi:hypothetical protein
MCLDKESHSLWTFRRCSQQGTIDHRDMKEICRVDQSIAIQEQAGLGVKRRSEKG